MKLMLTPPGKAATCRGSTPNQEAQLVDSLSQRAARYREEWERETNVPYGSCWCGCGEKTPPADRNRKKDGWVKGEPVRYLKGHARRKSGVAYVSEDRGYSSACHVWQRTVNVGGYGVTYDSRARRPRVAHRVLWEQRYGPIEEYLTLDHLCRVRACVNLDHLEVVSFAENIRRGASAKLDRTKVSEIRTAVASGERTAEIATRYGISQAHVQKLARGGCWDV